MGKYITLMIAFAFLSGCANNYEKFYVDQLSQNQIDRTSLIKPIGEPELVQGSNNKDLDYTRLTEDGYVMLGYSSFHATGGATKENLMAQAKKVGAAKVLFYSEYMSTESGSVPLTLPNTQTTYHSGGVSTYGSYSGTSTTYGTTTTQIPYTRHRYEYGASYWVKKRMGIFGVQVRDPNSQEKSDAGTNRGAIIVTSIRGGPAYKADIVAGDLVTAVNGEGIDGLHHLIEKIRNNRGQLTNFEILRKGKTIHKQIQLNNCSTCLTRSPVAIQHQFSPSNSRRAARSSKSTSMSHQSFPCAGRTIRTSRPMAAMRGAAVSITASPAASASGARITHRMRGGGTKFLKPDVPRQALAGCP